MLHSAPARRYFMAFSTSLALISIRLHDAPIAREEPPKVSGRARYGVRGALGPKRS